MSKRMMRYLALSVHIWQERGLQDKPWFQLVKLEKGTKQHQLSENNQATSPIKS